MECNKEEAFRAKTIAVKKMQDKDFVGARKFALKAQQLYPETENISQMICVCDVHCSAESKIFGNESDWYGILQIEHTADDTMIKKQYRKFALLLHPDKNKFSGAEAAFKLIGEAQRVLLDREKRSFFDMKRRTTYKPVIPQHASQQASKTVPVARQSRAQNNFTSNPSSNAKGFNAPSQDPKPQAQSGAANGKETFWTLCPFCSVRYQYYKDILNRALRCQSCKKPFLAYDMHAQTARPGSDATKPVFPQNDVPNVGATKAGSESVKVKPASNLGTQTGQNATSRSQKARQPQMGPDKVHIDGEQISKPSRKANGKRGKKQMEESSESFETDSSLESEEVEIQMTADTSRAERFDNEGDRDTRRSRRSKRHVSYNENASDDEETSNPSKRAKGCGSSSPLTEKQAAGSGTEQPSNTSKLSGAASASVSAKEETKEGLNKTDGSETVVGSNKKSSEADNGCSLDSSPEASDEPTYHEYPDPEFCDFDKDRQEQCFQVGQIWAAYDTVDAMPRFYARIKKIFSPGFKLRITWLEPDPDDKVGSEWVSADLPYACGKFKNGNSENTEDRLMFSHKISWRKGSGRDSVRIYPGKGETWAIFKNWDAKWYLLPENERRLEYEFVEILSEYDEADGIRVAQLGKLKGFASLFCRKDIHVVRIPPAELLRFAHRVPSHRMTGDERKDVPRGSFELDPGSITSCLEEITLPKMYWKPCIIDLSSSSTKDDPAATGKMAGNPASSYHNNDKVDLVKHENGLHGGVNGQEEIPDPEFFNFDCMKSVDKFEVNQVWALYCDMDSLPRFYGFVKKIDRSPAFKLQIAWLEACFLPTEIIQWKDKKMPISCGQFKLKVGKLQTYKSTCSFSHLLKVKADQKGKRFDIYPREGDVWALYKNWHPDMRRADLDNCEYDVVEVLAVDHLHFKVVTLERVRGFISVFKPQKSGNLPVTREIPGVELFRFSHQMPSFRLTDEKGGSLRGFWEIDPAAFPAGCLYKSK